MYRFIGWKVRDVDLTYNIDGTLSPSVKMADGTYIPSATFVENAIARNLTTRRGGTVTLEAQWDNRSYTVVYEKGTPSSPAGNAYKNVVSGEMEPLALPVSATASLTPVEYSVPGYTFIGWTDVYNDMSTVEGFSILRI